MNFAINTTLAIAGTRVRLSCNTGYVFPDGAVTRMSECLQTVQWDPPVNESCQGIHLASLFIYLLSLLIYNIIPIVLHWPELQSDETIHSIYFLEDSK